MGSRKRRSDRFGKCLGNDRGSTELDLRLASFRNPKHVLRSARPESRNADTDPRRVPRLLGRYPCKAERSKAHLDPSEAVAEPETVVAALVVEPVAARAEAQVAEPDDRCGLRDRHHGLDDPDDLRHGLRDHHHRDPVVERVVAAQAAVVVAVQVVEREQVVAALVVAAVAVRDDLRRGRHRDLHGLRHDRHRGLAKVVVAAPDEAVVAEPVAALVAVATCLLNR